MKPHRWIWACLFSCLAAYLSSPPVRARAAAGLRSARMSVTISMEAHSPPCRLGPFSLPVPRRIDRVKRRLHDCSDGSRRAHPSRPRDEGATYQALSYFSFTPGSSSSGTKNWVWPQEPHT